MKRRYLPALGLFAAVQMACVPDPVTPPTVSEGSHIPAITVERVQGCMTEYCGQFDGYSHRVHATVKVDEDGRVLDVALDGMPQTAPDLGACARVTLREMAVPESVLRMRPDEPPISQQQSGPARGMMGNVLVLGGAIALGELVAKAFGVSLILSVAIVVGWDVARKRPRPKLPYERTCNEHLTECLMSNIQDFWNEDLSGSSRCIPCAKVCQRDGNWPMRIELGDKFLSCEYWKHPWERRDP